MWCCTVVVGYIYKVLEDFRPIYATGLNIYSKNIYCQSSLPAKRFLQILAFDAPIVLNADTLDYWSIMVKLGSSETEATPM